LNSAVSAAASLAARDCALVGPAHGQANIALQGYVFFPFSLPPSLSLYRDLSSS
jgi:hypothetical protein